MVTSLLAQLQVGGVYTSYPLFESEGVELSMGPDIDEQWRPNTCLLTWNNQSGDMDPADPRAALYGLVGRNTSVRLKLGPSAGVVFAGEASSFRPDSTLLADGTRGRRWVTMEAAGQNRRVGRWDDPLSSAMYDYNLSITGLLGFWPMENGGTDTTSLSEISGAPGALAGTISGSVTFSAVDGPAGGDKALQLGTGGALSGKFSRVHTSGWQVLFHVKLDAVPGSATYLDMFSITLSNNNRFVWQVSNAGYNFVVYDPTGAVKGSFSSLAVVDLTKWVRCRVRFTFSAGTVTVEPAWYAQDDPTVWGVTFTYADSGTGALITWNAVQNAYTLNASYQHVLGTTNTAVVLTNTVQFNAYGGERAGDRAVRLCNQVGLSLTMVGNISDTPQMGRMLPKKFVDLMEECRVTDGGLLYDGFASGLPTFRTRRDIEKQGVALALNKTDTSLLQPDYGDNLIANDITVTNISGAVAKSVATSGPLSIQPPPAGVGRYQKKVDVNYSSDDPIDDRAAWEQGLGTVDRRWYRQITIDLLGNPGLLDTIIALKPGDLITLAGAEPDTVKLHLRNVNWKIQGAPIQATLTCVPADVADVGVLDGTRRLQARATTLAAGITAAATSLTLQMSDPDEQWRPGNNAVPVYIDGELITLGTVGAVTGSGPWTQAVTGCTRGVNGFTKAHLAGAAVTVQNPIWVTM